MAKIIGYNIIFFHNDFRGREKIVVYFDIDMKEPPVIGGSFICDWLTFGRM